MAVKLISIKCPECNAVLDLEDGRKQLFCSYCGTKILIDNDNEYIIRHIDEAKISQSNAEALVRLKELEFKEKENSRRRRGYIAAYTIAGLLAIVAAVVFLFDSSGEIAAVPLGISAYIAMFTWMSQDNNKN